MPPESDATPLDDLWRWKLRLFTSADLVGSTAFKAARGDSCWAATFKEFFSGFPQFVEAAYADLSPKLPECAERLKPWKFSGDEILFWVELRNFSHAAAHVLALKCAIGKFAEAWAAKEVPLRLKATAWLAGFPVTNTEIYIGDESEDQAKTLDFIGPSIDLGFRIAKFCDERRFVISADLALMLLDAVDALEIDRKHFHIHLHGRESLKGVIGNKPYPILWLDMRDGQPLLEERLLGIQRDFRSDDLKDYLRQFLDETPQLRRPFIAGDGHHRYGAEDPKLTELREEMRAEETNRHYLSQGESEPPGEGAPREPSPPPDKLRPDDLTLGYF